MSIVNISLMIDQSDMIKVSHFRTRFRSVFSDNIWKAADFIDHREECHVFTPSAILI